MHFATYVESKRSMPAATPCKTSSMKDKKRDEYTTILMEWA